MGLSDVESLLRNLFMQGLDGNAQAYHAFLK